MLFKLNINGKTRSVEAEPGTPLLWVIRDELNLTGTKFGCGVAACGACTVHFNGTPIRSCSFPVDSAAGNDITTIEGLQGKVAEAVQQAWRDKDVPAIFPAAAFEDLRRLCGDRGAKSMLLDANREIDSVPLAAAATDIDTEADIGR